MSTSGEALGDGEVLAAFNGELRTLKDGVDRTRRLLDQTKKLVRYQRELLNTTRGAADAAGTSPGARAAVLDTQRMRRRVEAAGLTPRQHEILLLVAKGLSTKEIGKELWLSPATVRNHVSAILGTLAVHSRLQAVAKAEQLGLLPRHRGTVGVSRVAHRNDAARVAGTSSVLQRLA